MGGVNLAPSVFGAFAAVKRVYFAAVIYEAVSAGSGHTSSSGGMRGGDALDVLGEMGADLQPLIRMTHDVSIDKCH